MNQPRTNRDARATARSWMLQPRTGTQDDLLDAYRDQVLTEAAELIATLPQDYELDPGRGDARQHLLAARTQTTWPDRACGCSARFDRHADGCPTLTTAAAVQGA